MEATADIGLIGLAVMGQNLVLNMSDHGFTPVVYNRTTSKVEDFLANEAKGTNIIGATSIEEFIAHLKRPRKVMMMIKAGAAVDRVIEQVTPLLEEGDIIIDGGNSNYHDSIRRTKSLEEKGLLFAGVGISGGEEGARYGPSIMPGGSPAAWQYIQPILQSIAAKVEDGTPCCDWVGEDGAGHFVKMVHNGIEYGDMQLIAEAYQMMRDGLDMTPNEISDVFRKWDDGKLDSYLIEITGDILAYKDDDGAPLIDKILDSAGQKGTGKWTAITALEIGIPLTLIGEAVFARFLSALKDQRVQASKVLQAKLPANNFDKETVLANLEQGLYLSKIMSYTQGYMLMQAAAEAFDWHLNYGGIALMWREGCIIRSRFLQNIQDAYKKSSDLQNLLLDDYFKAEVDQGQVAWRNTVMTAIGMGIPVPAMSSALAFYDGYRHETVPANIIQAQRDYFGAHTYERIDQPRGEFFHTNWTGEGGSTTSSSYNA